jgi:hypothetical protein
MLVYLLLLLYCCSATNAGLSIIIAILLQRYKCWSIYYYCYIVAALQMLHGWSLMHDVNLIPGCYQQPSEGHTGCGMFFHDGGYTVSITSGDSVLWSSVTIGVTSVKTQVTGERSAGEIGFQSENMTQYTAVKLEYTTEYTEIEACHNSLCCLLSYQMSELPLTADFHYQLLAFDGIKKHANGRVGWRTQVCGLVACSGVEVTSCGDMPELASYRNETQFSALVLTGNFNSSLVIPSLLLADLTPYHSVQVTDEDYNVTLALTTQTRDVHTFALYSGVLGVEEYDTDSGHVVTSSLLLLVTLLCVTSSCV